ncbi:YybH family protein [Pontibacter chitinilyticus]|uniref:YybH family protein n=1 Tax=Pontibacter chitinilyticus TaxID=2674989 RepID=UPI0032196D41
MKNSYRFILAAGLCLATACTSSKAVYTSADDEAQVQQVLTEQSACWNRGDLPCYMQGYWQSDSLLFIGKRGLTYGWQQTLDNYKRSYPDAAAMGQLTFDLKEMRQLSPETMLVVGKWRLQRDAAAGNLEGYFSIILQKFTDGWKIIADHSS